MLPVLFSIDSISLYTFGFLVALGFFLFAFFFFLRLRDLGYDEEKIIDFLLVFSLLSFLFSRAGFILSHFRSFGFSLSHWLLFGRYPGFSFWGLFLGGFLAIFWFCRQNRWNLFKTTDEISFSFLPFLVLFQLACFFDGSLKGVPTNMPWGVFFPGDFIRRQPVALFGALALLLIWFLLLWIERRWRVWQGLKDQSAGLVTLIFLNLSFLASLVLAFWQEGGVYYLWIERGLIFLGFLLISFFFLKRWQIKPIKKNKR